MPHLCRVLLALCVAFAAIPALAGETAPSEERFEQLRSRYEAARDEYYSKSEELPEGADEWLFYIENHPANTMPGEFLALEEDCRGSLVGLSCLHQLVSAALGVGDEKNEPIWTAYETAVERLSDHYASHRDLDLVLLYLRSRRREGATRDLLRQACESPHRHVRGYALFRRAHALCSDLDSWETANNVLSLIGDDPAFADRADRLRPARDRWTAEDSDRARREMLSLLSQVSKEYADVLSPPQTGLGPKLLRIERSATDPLTELPRKTLGSRAESLRFEAGNLRIGCQAPEIAGPDVHGTPLRLSDFRGKVVVLMFSFKGCGPCERMYPDNRKLIESMKDRPFALLGVMGDETPQTVEQAIADGTITWPVWHDGMPGPIEMKWNVGHWPTIYVLDREGVIRYRELRGELLERAVGKLVAEAESAGAVP